MGKARSNGNTDKLDRIVKDIALTERKISEALQSISEYKIKLKQLTEEKTKEEDLRIIAVVRKTGLSVSDISEILSEYVPVNPQKIPQTILRKEITEPKGEIPDEV